MEKYTEILKNDLFLQSLKKELETESSKPTMKLTGGAVVDILRGATPKDYDLIHNSGLEKAMRDNKNFVLLYTSKATVTFQFNGRIIQLLYKDVDSFPYTLEQGTFNLSNSSLSNFDEQSFTHFVLVPTQKAFAERKIARIGVKRVLHWQRKGWGIQDITFNSLCNTAFKDSKNKSNGVTDEDDDEEYP